MNKFVQMWAEGHCLFYSLNIVYIWRDVCNLDVTVKRKHFPTRSSRVYIVFRFFFRLVALCLGLLHESILCMIFLFLKLNLAKAPKKSYPAFRSQNHPRSRIRHLGVQSVLELDCMNGEQERIEWDSWPAWERMEQIGSVPRDYFTSVV